jgi:hypothetical protein
MNSFFVGNKSKPSFLVEVIPDKKIVSIYKPDKYSKNQEFHDKYALGEMVIRTKFNNIYFNKKPVSYKDFLFVPEIMLKIKKKYLVISKTITENENENASFE